MKDIPAFPRGLLNSRRNDESEGSMTPEDEEFNRIEMESRIKQDYVRDIKQPSREQLMAEVTVLTELVRVLSARVKELEGKHD